MTTTVRVNRCDDIMNAFRGVLPSPLPAVVFTSLASACVPTFSDRCEVLVEEDGMAGYRIERPYSDHANQRASIENQVRNARPSPSVSGHTLQTHVAGAPARGHPGYRVLVLYGWDAAYTPTGADVELAQIAVEHAGEIVNRERELCRPYRDGQK